MDLGNVSSMTLTMSRAMCLTCVGWTSPAVLCTKPRICLTSPAPRAYLKFQTSSTHLFKVVKIENVFHFIITLIYCLTIRCQIYIKPFVHHFYKIIRSEERRVGKECQSR